MKNNHARQEIALDNTSSVRVVLPSKKFRSRMKRSDKPFEVEYRGVIIRCATSEQAAQVAKDLGASSEAAAFQVKWQPHEFLDFVNRIQHQQRRLLAFLLKAQYHRAKDEDIRQALKLKGNQALAGILSGITKVAQALEIDPARIYFQRTEYKQGLPYRLYHLATGFAQAAGDSDWPEQKDLEEPETDDTP